ncbi:hypothetical protein CITRIK5_20366 [Citricoccus sp. K5]|nr:hypothetical protein CITRIK5_20366 [Citricoccus sp. K5]
MSTNGRARSVTRRPPSAGTGPEYRTPPRPDVPGRTHCRRCCHGPDRLHPQPATGRRWADRLGFGAAVGHSDPEPYAHAHPHPGASRRGDHPVPGPPHGGAVRHARHRLPGHAG